MQFLERGMGSGKTERNGSVTYRYRVNKLNCRYLANSCLREGGKRDSKASIGDKQRERVRESGHDGKGEYVKVLRSYGAAARRQSCPDCEQIKKKLI